MDCYIDKKTGTYAETLEAVGLASAARELGFRGVRVTDKGTHFRIHSEQDSVAHGVLSAGYPYIWLKSKEPECPTIRFFDYEGEKEKRDAAKKVGKKAKTVLDAVEIEAPAVHPDLNPATMLASMRKGWNGDRDLALWIAAVSPRVGSPAIGEVPRSIQYSNPESNFRQRRSRGKDRDPFGWLSPRSTCGSLLRVDENARSVESCAPLQVG
jgi:hypothetical protein